MENLFVALYRAGRAGIGKVEEFIPEVVEEFHRLLQYTRSLLYRVNEVGVPSVKPDVQENPEWYWDKLEVQGAVRITLEYQEILDQLAPQNPQLEKVKTQGVDKLLRALQWEDPTEVAGLMYDLALYPGADHLYRWYFDVYESLRMKYGG